MRYSLRQLAVFVAVARHDNVSLAADSLAMSQSAASTALAELERQFDCRLFDRHGKRLRLNGLGRELLPKAIALLDQAEELEQLLGQQDATGSLEIGATLTIGNYLAPQIIGDFLHHHPASRVELHVHNTHQLIDKLVHFELDIGLVEGEVEHPLLEATHWVSDRLSIFCAPSHPLAQGEVTLERCWRHAGSCASVAPAHAAPSSRHCAHIWTGLRPAFPSASTSCWSWNIPKPSSAPWKRGSASAASRASR